MAKTKEENKVEMISPALAVNGMKQVRRGLLLAVALMFLDHDAPGAQAPVPLGAERHVWVLGATTVTSSGATMISWGSWGESWHRRDWISRSDGDAAPGRSCCRQAQN